VLLFVYNRFPDAWGHPSRTTWPYADLSDDIREMGFSSGTIISPRSGVAGNLVFQFPEAHGLTGEYTAIPVSYRPPVLIAWDERFGGDGESVRTAFRAVCGNALPDPLPDVTLQANYVGSKKSFTMHVALIDACK
jgi:hypothetical protein